jgi:hypothetical protein
MIALRARGVFGRRVASASGRDNPGTLKPRTLGIDL